MPRKVRDSNLDTRSARNRLKASNKPLFRLIEPGLHLGYRKRASGPGSWVVRRYSGHSRYTVENLRTDNGRLLVADDYSDADGVTILSFGQAQERAKVLRPAGSEHAGPFTVADAMKDYFAYLESHGKPARTARSHDRIYIQPHFGTMEVVKLTPAKIKDWLGGMVKGKPHVRTSKGKPQRFKAIADDDEAMRRRRSSANRTFATLKAALNQAWRDGKVASDTAWRRVRPFHSVDAARVRYLTIAESRRLINACPADFRKLAQGALQSGARYGQLARLIASDFDADNGTLRLSTRKGTGREKIYHAVLTEEGARFFAEACAGLGSADPIFLRTDGGRWNETDQSRPMEEACKNAKLIPPIGFHGLRHTWASLAVMNGVPLLVIAKNLGHSDTRMVEKHYGHMAPSYVADAIRAGAPKFGFTSGNKIVALVG